MTNDTVKPIPDADFFTAFIFHHGINVLVRSADWYKLPPIQRYLYNMAASEIRMEDAKTEGRTYTFFDFDLCRMLIEQSKSQLAQAAESAWDTWSECRDHFGVVHLYTHGYRKGELLFGDDPDDWMDFDCEDDCGRLWEFEQGLENSPNFTGEE